MYYKIISPTKDGDGVKELESGAWDTNAMCFTTCYKGIDSVEVFCVDSKGYTLRYVVTANVDEGGEQQPGGMLKKVEEEVEEGGNIPLGRGRISSVLGVSDVRFDKGVMKVKAVVGGDEDWGYGQGWDGEEDGGGEETAMWCGFNVKLSPKTGTCTIHKGAPQTRTLLQSLIKSEHSRVHESDRIIDDCCKEVCKGWGEVQDCGKDWKDKVEIGYRGGMLVKDAGGEGRFYRLDYTNLHNNSVDDNCGGEFYEGGEGFEKGAALNKHLRHFGGLPVGWGREDCGNWVEVFKMELLEGIENLEKGNFTVAVEDAVKNTVRKIGGGGGGDVLISMNGDGGEEGEEDVFVSYGKGSSKTIGIKTTVFNASDGKGYVVMGSGGREMKAAMALMMVLEGGRRGGEGETWEERRYIKVL